MTFTSLVLLAAAQLASTHFALEYPEWRGNTLTNKSYSQYTFPCGGVPVGVAGGNRTDWSTTGGSLKLDLHHPWTYVFVNLGLGDNVTNFNYTLNPQPLWNATGNGTLCVPSISLPANLKPSDGQKATVQVVTLGESGNALYNCADITFKANASPFGGANCTTNGVTASIVGQSGTSCGSSGGGGSGTGNSTGGGATTVPKNAGSANSASLVALTAVVGLAVAFAML